MRISQPWVNSYMANVIGAVPIRVGANGMFQPYVSGGFGALTLRSDELLSEEGEAQELEPDDSKFAGNIGFGLMGHRDNIGLRGDFRFFRGFETDEDFDPVEHPAEAIGNQILSDLEFWRATFGVSFRW